MASAAEGVHVPHGKRTSVKALADVEDLRGRHVTATIKSVWPLQKLDSSSTASTRWGSAQRLLRLLLQEFQCADSEGNEILIFLYDRWADRMAPLVAAGDLIHVAGTGVLVRPNTMRSLPSDHPCRLVIAEPGLMAGLQPDTQGEIQSLSLPPALHAFQSEGSVPPFPESTPAAAAAPSQGPSITLHVQTLVQAGTRYTCGTKSAFTAGQRVTTASLHECPNLPSLAGKASRRGELPSVIEGHAALAPPSAKRPRLDDHSPAIDKPGLTSMEEWLTGLVKLSKRKKSRKGKRGRAQGKESEGGREPAAPALGWSGASPGTPPSLRQGQAGQSPHPCEMATQMPPPVHPCEAETQAWVNPCEGETQPPPLPDPCDCATQPPDMKRMAAEEDQPESDASRDAGDASDRQAADDLAALSSQQQGAGHGPAGQALPFRYSLSQAAHDSSNTTNSTPGALQVSGGSTVAALEAMQPQDGASNVAGCAKELPSGVQLASQLAGARVGYARSMSSAAVAQGGRAITPQNVSETGPWMSLALAHRARGGRTTKYSYTVLNKMKVGSTVNVYGVVLDTGLPFKSSGTDFKSRLLIVDEDRPSLAQACPVEVFLPNPSQHPIPREVGDVVRLHRVKANVFQSQEQLVLSGRNNRSAAVLFRRDGTYFSTSDSFSLSPAAAERVSELSAWGDALLKSKRLFTSPYLRSVGDLTSPSQAFQGYVGTGVDMLGCVGAVFVNGEKLAGPWTREKKQALDAQCHRAGSGAACSVQLVLWDGTGSHGSSAASLPQGVSLQDIYPPCSGGVQLGSFVYVDTSDQAGLEALNLQPGDWLRVRNAMACALKGGCFPHGAAIPEIDPGSTLLFVKAARSGFIKVPPFALDVQERLKAFAAVSRRRATEELRQLQETGQVQFSVLSGHPKAPTTSIQEVVACPHTPCKYRVSGWVIGHWPPRIVNCVSLQDGDWHYCFTLRIARNRRDPAHIDVQDDLFAAVPACDLQHNAHSLDRLQRLWEWLYAHPVDMVVLAGRHADSQDGPVLYQLLHGIMSSPPVG